MRANLLHKNPATRPFEQRLERWILDLSRGATRLGFQIFPGISRASLAMEASPLSPASGARFFSTDLREISPTLNEDLLDLYGRSEQALANLFAFHNVSEALEGDFDWEMHESAAWRRELHSFDYALSLGMTYRISQETRYAQHLRYLISHWIAQNAHGNSTGWELGPLARRVRNWVLAWDLARLAWQEDPEFQEVFWQSLAMQCVYLCGHTPQAASMPEKLQCARAMWMASLAFENSGEKFAADALALLHQETEILSSRCGAELPRPIELYELAEALLEQLIFVPLVTDGHETESREATRRVLTMLEATLAPDGTLPMLGPAARSKVDELSDLYALAAVIFDEPRWKNLAGKFGILPYLILGERGKLQFDKLAEEPWHSSSSEVPELALARVSGGNRSAMIINSRPQSSDPDHQDALSYELYVAGQRVVVDSGPYSPEGETWSKYFASAEAHNVLLVDGHPPRADAAAWHSLVSGEQQFPSPPQSPMPGQSRNDESSSFPGIFHRRAFFSIAGNAWALVDRLTGEGKHQVTNLVHLFPTFEVEIHGDHALARSRSLSVTIHPMGFHSSRPNESVLQTWRGPGTQFQGLYSPDFGVKFPSSVVAITSRELQLPWLGGYVISQGSESTFKLIECDLAGGRIVVELSGKTSQFVLS